MKITTQTRYGAQAMIELSSTWKAKHISVSTIAKKQNLSMKYLEHIIASLKAAGLIESKPHIGYRITRSPKKIYMHEIYLALENHTKIITCDKNDTICPKMETCLTKDLWEGLDDAIISYLSSITLFDLANGSLRKKRKS